MSWWCRAHKKHLETEIDPRWIDVRKLAPPKDQLCWMFVIEHAGSFTVGTRFGLGKVGYGGEPLGTDAKVTHWMHATSPPLHELHEHLNLMKADR